MSDVILHETFDGDLDTGFPAGLLAKELVTLAPGEGRNGSNAVRVAYEGCETGSRCIVYRHPLGVALQKATLSFVVCFEDDFQWTHGGKLHGLGPEYPVAGGQQRRPNGWSARIMWKEDGKCSTYLYDQDKTNKWGVGETTPEPVFTLGRWHEVDLEVGVNEPGQADGYAIIRVDGSEVMRTENMIYRGQGGDDTLITKLLFSTFHGGNTTYWTPVDKDGKWTTVHALYDEFKVVAG